MRMKTGAGMARLRGRTMRARVAGFVVAVATPLLMASPAHAMGVSIAHDALDPVEGNAGATVVNFSASATCGLLESGSIPVYITLGNGTATGGSDYASTATPASVTVTCGGLLGGTPGPAQPFSVSVSGDTLNEPDETFTVDVKDGGGNPIGGAPFTVTIKNDDPVPSVAIGNGHGAEGTGAGAGGVDIPVTLSAPSGKQVSVPYTLAPGTALAPGDFDATGGTVTIAAGQTSGAIHVATVKDNVDEPDETLTATLGTPTNATLGSQTTATGTIDNDDVPTITVGSASAPEGNSGVTTFTFPITLSNPSARTITVKYATADVTTASVPAAKRATAGQDYTPVATSTATFSPGETSKSFPVNVLPDRLIESDEVFAVQLSEASPVGTLANGGLGVGAILNDDTAAGGGTLPGGGGTPVPTPGGDTTAPKAKLGALKFKKPKRLTISLTCPATEANCRTTLTIFSVPIKKSKVKGLRKELRLGSKQVVVPGGTTATITINVSAKNAKLLKQGKSVKAKAYAVVRDDAGNVATASKNGTLKA
jgi:hypothetical protein